MFLSSQRALAALRSLFRLSQPPRLIPQKAADVLKHRNTETQKHRDTETQRHRDTETQRSQRKRAKQNSAVVKLSDSISVTASPHSCPDSTASFHKLPCAAIPVCARKPLTQRFHKTHSAESLGESARRANRPTSKLTQRVPFFNSATCLL